MATPAEIDAIHAAIKTLVIRRTLHHYYEDKDALLRERVSRRMDAIGLDAAAYLAVLESGPGSDAEWTALESDITIGETFFFRFAEQFAALADTILPELIRDRAGTRRLRIWSAGCSTGAEPYSVAILLHRLLGAQLADWSVSILGTDLNETALETARVAEYGDWALRSLSDVERRRDFVPVADRRAGPSTSVRWQLRPVYRRMVRFERQNLLDLLEAAPSMASDYDLVLCRNVLIYFHADKVQALVRRFGESLAPDGWLLLGHAEAASSQPPGLKPAVLDGTVVWKRADAPAASPENPSVAIYSSAPASSGARLSMMGTPHRDQARDVAVAVRDGLARARRHPAEANSANGSGRGVEAVADTSRRDTSITGLPPKSAAEREAVEQVRVDAGTRTPDAAWRLCREAIERHPLCPELFFYAALLERALGRESAAEADFRRAIYLCKHFAMAHYHLGLLLTDAGHVASGRRSIAEAGRIAHALPDDAEILCGDGMTAIRLRRLAGLDWLGESSGRR